MQSLFEENKRFILIAAGVVVLLITAIVVYNLSNIQSSDIDTKPSFIQGEYSLPKKDSVKQETSPLMYDFVSGTLGLNEDYINMTGSDQYVFLTKEDSSKVYFAYKKANEGDDSIKLYLPRFSSEPLQYYLKSEDDMSQFFSGISSDGNAVKVVEGEYTFYIVSKIDDLSDYHGIDVSWLIGNSLPGDQAKAVEAGHGYPTNIIREKCDLAKIKEISGIDFNNKFWDRVNYDSKIKCFDTKDSSKYIILTPVKQKPISDGDSVYTFLVNNNSMPFNEKELNDYITRSRFEPIDSAITNHIYANQTEVSKAAQFK